MTSAHSTKPFDPAIERFQRFAETSSEGIWEIDVAGKTSYSNPRMRELLGFSEKELKSINSFDLVHPEDKAAAAAQWERRLQGHAEAGEWRLRRKDGNYIWVQSSATPILDESGVVVGAFAMFTEIGEKRRVLENLHQSELFNRSILDSIQDCIKVLDLEGRILSMNSNGRKALQVTSDDQIISRKWTEFWEGADRQAAETALCHARAGRTGRMVGSICLENEAPKWWDVAITPIVGTDGKPFQLLAVSRNVTEQKRVEAELLRKEKIYRAIGESIEYGIWICNAEGRNIYASESFLNLLGITQEQCSEFNWGHYLHPDDMEGTLAAWKDCVRTGKPWFREHRFKGQDGAWHSILARGVPIKNEDGTIACWAGINLNISELKQSEHARKETEGIVARQDEELARLETQQRVILENLPVGVWFLDKSGQIVYGNRAGKEIWRGAEFVGMDELHVYKAWWHHNGQPLSAEDWAGGRAVREKRSFLDQTLDIECFDGSRKTILNSAVPIVLESGELYGAVVFNLDVTDRARAEAALRESHTELEKRVSERTRELQETVGDLEAFSYSMSHDMRAPLRAMYGFSQILLNEYGRKLDDTACDYLRRIDRGAKRLDLLIRDVLSYSRIGKESFELIPINLDALLEELISHYPGFQEPHAKVHLIGKLGTVPGHEAFLSQIFSNLISNAVKFARKDVPPVVRIRSENVEGAVRVWVEDNGIGIAPEHFDRVFTMFGRVYSEKEFEGTGIGLAIVRKAVERMGAQIGVESKLNEGSRFWLKFPLMK